MSCIHLLSTHMPITCCDQQLEMQWATHISELNRPPKVAELLVLHAFTVMHITACQCPGNDGVNSLLQQNPAAPFTAVTRPCWYVKVLLGLACSYQMHCCHRQLGSFECPVFELWLISVCSNSFPWTHSHRGLLVPFLPCPKAIEDQLWYLTLQPGWGLVC